MAIIPASRLKWIDEQLRLGTETRAGIASMCHITPLNLSGQLSRARKAGILPPTKMGRVKSLRTHLETSLDKLPESEEDRIYARHRNITKAKKHH